MKQYSAENKAAIIKRMMPPNPITIPALSLETGIPTGTLYTWKAQYQAQGYSVPASAKPSSNWSAPDKLVIVFETRALNVAELGEYCRKKGLYPEQIKAWEAAALSGYQQQEQLDKQQLVM